MEKELTAKARRSIQRGEADIKKGRTYPTKKVIAILQREALA